MTKKEYKEELKYIKQKTEDLIPNVQDILYPLNEIEEILQQAVEKADKNGFSLDIDIEQIISGSVTSIIENWEEYKDIIDACELFVSNLEEWRSESSENKQSQIQEYIDSIQRLMDMYYNLIPNSDSEENVTEQLREIMEYINEVA